MEAFITYEQGTPIWSTVAQRKGLERKSDGDEVFWLTDALVDGVDPSTVSVQAGPCEPRRVDAFAIAVTEPLGRRLHAWWEA